MTGKQLSATARYVPFFFLLLLAVGLGGWLLSFLWLSPDRVWRALLIGYLFLLSLTGGLVAWLAIITAADGKWAQGHEDTAGSGMLFFLPSTLALLALWGGSTSWAPWYDMVTPQGAWLDNSFLFGRQIVALLLFWGLALLFLKRRRTESGRRLAALCILVFGFSFSLIGFDLVMALDYHWHSSLFGGYFFISSLYIAIAAWGLAAAWRSDASPELRHSIGTLLLAFCLLTTYLMFSQLLPIWYENLPGETRFFYARYEHTPAVWISFVLLATVYLGPLVLLLRKKARQGRLSLGLVSAMVLVFMWIERWWLVAPTFSHDTLPGTAEAAITAALLGAWGCGVALRGRESGGAEREENG